MILLVFVTNVNGQTASTRVPNQFAILIFIRILMRCNGSQSLRILGECFAESDRTILYKLKFANQTTIRPPNLVLDTFPCELHTRRMIILEFVCDDQIRFCFLCFHMMILQNERVLINCDGSNVFDSVGPDDHFVVKSTLLSFLYNRKSNNLILRNNLTINEVLNLTSFEEDHFQVLIPFVTHERSTNFTNSPSTRRQLEVVRILSFTLQTTFDHVLVSVGVLVLKNHHVRTNHTLGHTTLKWVLLPTSQFDFSLCIE